MTSRSKRAPPKSFEARKAFGAAAQAFILTEVEPISIDAIRIAHDEVEALAEQDGHQPGDHR